MAKKSVTISESSLHARLKKEKSKFIAKEIKDEDIDCSDIPELTDETLQRLVRLPTRSKTKTP